MSLNLEKSALFLIEFLLIINYLNFKMFVVRTLVLILGLNTIFLHYLTWFGFSSRSTFNK